MHFTGEHEKLVDLFRITVDVFNAVIPTNSTECDSIDFTNSVYYEIANLISLYLFKMIL